MFEKIGNMVLLGGGIAIFLVCLFTLLINERKFAGVEGWPAVPAEIIESETKSFSTRRETFTGSEVGSVAIDSVLFEYEVNGVVYKSRLASPNGGGLPSVFGESSLMAFYNPARPNVGVLNPTEYDGSFQKFVLAFGTVFLAIIAWAQGLWQLEHRFRRPNKTQHHKSDRAGGSKA